MAELSPLPSGRRLERDLTLDRRKSVTFMGKFFYLDLPHNKQTQLLTKAISNQGGVIESFLSRDVNYVVTWNRKAADMTNGESSARKGKNCPLRPATENIEKTPYSRGKQLLKKVVQSQECSSVLSSARSWGVCILHLDEVLEHLECLVQRGANRLAARKEAGGAGRTLKVGKLKSPFLKIEDQSRKYRPIHCSFSNFPECSFISSDRSPFEMTRTNNSTHKDRDPGDQAKDEGERAQNWEKSGYCECCLVTYAKLSEHLISEQHCLFALNTANYRAIDDITSLIDCDFVLLPHGFKPSEEQCEDKAPEPSLTGEECLQKEEDGQREPKTLPVDLCIDHPMEDILVLPERLHVKPDAECTMYKDPPVDNMAMNLAQAHTRDLLVEDNGPPCTLGTTNALLQCELPLQAAEGSHLGLVTEVSWYTEDTGLTSVYTVQSLVIPPAPVLDHHPELTMENASVQPSLLLGALGDAPYALAQGAFKGSVDDSVHGDLTPAAHTELEMINAASHQTSELLAAEPQNTSPFGLYSDPPSAPTTGSECTLQHPDAALGVEVPMVESAVDQPQHVLLVSSHNKLLMNTPCELPTELSNHLPTDPLTLASWHSSAEDNVTVTPSTAPLGNLVDPQEPEPLVPTSDYPGGKRKHCWSPCHPPAKRQTLHCQPMPMWVFHQLPSSTNQPPVPLFSDWVDRDSSNRAAEDEDAVPPTLCFNPKMARCEVSSESDWDSQLVSQCHNDPHQTDDLGELRTAQVSLDESWYGKRLCSVLAHEQTLGSPNTTQTVTLSHTSFDVYLSGVAS